MSGKFKFGKKRQFADINEGYKAGYDVKPEMMDPAKLLEVYTKALSRALVTRELIKHLRNSDISPVVVPVGQGFTRKLPILINSERQASMLGSFIGSHYTKFNHPF